MKKNMLLTEEKIKRIVKESLVNFLKEEFGDDFEDGIDPSFYDENPHYKKTEMDWDWDEMDRHMNYLDNQSRLNKYDDENSNIHDNSKNYHPYTNYLARNSSKYVSPEDKEKLTRPEYGKGFNGSGEYIDLWDGDK